MLIWLMFGIVAGIVAHILEPKGTKGGIVTTVLFAVSGALLGGVTANMFFGTNFQSFDVFSFVVAIGAAITLLLIHHTLFAKTNRI